MEVVNQILIQSSTTKRSVVLEFWLKKCLKLLHFLIFLSKNGSVYTCHMFENSRLVDISLKQTNIEE